MADGKIYITISSESLSSVMHGAAGKVAPTSAGNEREQAKGTLAGDYIKHQFFNLMESQAKSIINYSIANIGNFTGDYNAQRNINASLNILGRLRSVGLSAIAGSKFGVGGAIAATAASVITQGVQIFEEYKSNAVAIDKQNNEIAELRRLSGLNYLTNGSR